MLRVKNLILLCLVAIPSLALAQLPTVLIRDTDGELQPVQSLTEPQMEVVLSSLSTHLEQRTLPPVSPEATILIRPVDFDIDTLSFIAIDLTQPRELRATPRYGAVDEGLEVRFAEPLTGQLLIMAFNPNPNNPAHRDLVECAWVFAVIGTAPPEPELVHEIEESMQADVELRQRGL